MTSIDADTVKKLTDFLNALDQEGISATDIISTFKATKQTPVANIEKKLGIYQASNPNSKFHQTIIPRVGNVDSNGVWTGKGKNGQGKFVKDYHCHRNLDLEHKTLSEISKIKKQCKKKRLRLMSM